MKMMMFRWFTTIGMNDISSYRDDIFGSYE